MKRIFIWLFVCGMCAAPVCAQQTDNPLEDMLFVEQDQQFDEYRRAEDSRIQGALRMPNVNGWSQERALSLLQSLDYRLHPVIKNAPSEGAPGRVVVQRPLPGQSLEGAQIVLFVSTELLDTDKRAVTATAPQTKSKPLAGGGFFLKILLFLLAQVALLTGWVGVTKSVESKLEIEKPNELAIISGGSKPKSELEPVSKRSRSAPLTLD